MDGRRKEEEEEDKEEEEEEEEEKKKRRRKIGIEGGEGGGEGGGGGEEGGGGGGGGGRRRAVEYAKAAFSCGLEIGLPFCQMFFSSFLLKGHLVEGFVGGRRRRRRRRRRNFCGCVTDGFWRRGGERKQCVWCGLVGLWGSTSVPQPRKIMKRR